MYKVRDFITSSFYFLYIHHTLCISCTRNITYLTLLFIIHLSPEEKLKEWVDPNANFDDPGKYNMIVSICSFIIVFGLLQLYVQIHISNYMHYPFIKTVPPTEGYTLGLLGNNTGPTPFYAKHTTDKGRSLFASRDIKEGKQMYGFALFPRKY